MNIEENITLRNADLKENTLIIGKKGSGKTETLLKPLLLELLEEYSKGNRIGVTVIESNKGLSFFTKAVSHRFGLSYTGIDINEGDFSFNIMEGEANDVVNQLHDTFKNLFDKENRFFATEHQLILKNIVLLLKKLHNDELYIFDVSSVLKNKQLLIEKINIYKKIHGIDEIIDFLENELLGSLADKYDTFTKKIILTIESLNDTDIALNVFGNKTTIDLDSHVAKGGILTVTTENKTSGLFLAKSLLMRLQNTIIDSDDHIPHYIIINDAGTMLNSDTELFLSLTDHYNTSSIYAVEQLKDLEVECDRFRAMEMKRMIINKMKNRIVFNQGLSDEDAKELIPYLNCGKVILKEKRLFGTKEKEYNLDIENIHFFPKYTFIHQLMIDGKRENVGLGMGSFVPEKYNWLKK